jgi:hypothetical protein
MVSTKIIINIFYLFSGMLYGPELIQGPDNIRPGTKEHLKNRGRGH